LFYDARIHGRQIRIGIRETGCKDSRWMEQNRWDPVENLQVRIDKSFTSLVITIVIIIIIIIIIFIIMTAVSINPYPANVENMVSS
jgi:hypothetical protein